MSRSMPTLYKIHDLVIDITCPETAQEALKDVAHTHLVNPTLKRHDLSTRIRARASVTDFHAFIEDVENHDQTMSVSDFTYSYLR